ncbi:hypothetical protein E5288_WYG006729 [Bos mutus]|uniref:Uncharacterized protein n=1 Tax=Bos mutus TaxID=72004 RepID=A0A6B0RE86_9CETA|nr:hypothetical protein [Bos mutus]
MSSPKKFSDLQLTAARPRFGETGHGYRTCYNIQYTDMLDESPGREDRRAFIISLVVELLSSCIPQAPVFDGKYHGKC